eukprot:Blabericola_migrator_1__12515@NODE_792_length_6486_cov_25_403022_g561_i0_p2_GENE_NODE_792_length_6486_cov_25_403022_g561_i0NODE_792_length_6486_cov_25_403022_g561_i0_p2_ORF_typecomplete_len169_score5_69CBP_BcsF/PF11120_8/0_21_NODE_792_length_6486_cov_25_403022_g561_i06531159
MRAINYVFSEWLSQDRGLVCEARFGTCSLEENMFKIHNSSLCSLIILPQMMLLSRWVQQKEESLFFLQQSRRNNTLFTMVGSPVLYLGFKAPHHLYSCVTSHTTPQLVCCISSRDITYLLALIGDSQITPGSSSPSPSGGSLTSSSWFGHQYSLCWSERELSLLFGFT